MAGKELVARVQEEVQLERRLHLVVVRSGQVMLTTPAEHFVQSVEYRPEWIAEGIAERLHPRHDIRDVVMDPLRQFGEPVVRSVPTEVIAEQVRAGDRIDVDFRHDITHPKPIPQDVKLGGTEAPGHGPSVQARKTCFFVRRCLLEVARAIGAPPPGYLAYCPPGPYDDDDAWRTAVLMTGVREDPDFPNRQERG